MSPGGAPRARAAVAAAGLAVLLASLVGAVAVRKGAPLGPDLPLHRWALRHRHDGVSTAAVALTATGTGLPAYLVAAVAGAAGRTSGAARRRGAAAAAVALAAGQLVRVGLVEWVGRPRPPVADWGSHAAGPALPSGHTTNAALAAAVLVLALRRAALRPGTRVVACTVAVLWALGVGATRVYLGVHWPTDVLAAWLLTGCLTAAVLAWRPAVGPHDGTPCTRPLAGPGA